MASRKAQRERLRQERLAREAEERRAARRRTLTIRIVASVVGAVAILGAVFVISNSGGESSSDEGEAGKYEYAVGQPGPGEKAPPIKLPSTEGGTFDLAEQRGQGVLLFFQEGLTCQPCFDQIVDLEPQMGELKALGIDQLVSVTTDPLDQLEQKVADEGITTPVLSDPDLAVSNQYTTNQYGMMGQSRNGHTFILVGPDGRLRWRADYGGPPNFTMYLPPADLVADLRAGTR